LDDDVVTNNQECNHYNGFKKIYQTLVEIREMSVSLAKAKADGGYCALFDRISIS